MGRKDKEDAVDVELATTGPKDIDLSGITSMADAIAMWETTHRAEDILGDGFAMIDDKNRLVGVPFFIPHFKVVEGDFGTFAVISVVTTDNERLRFTDGSTGVRQQLEQYTEKTGQDGGLLCQGGLVRSDYDYVDPIDNTKKPATTFYIAES